MADSLSGLAVPGIREAAAIADLGSGAGFPGLALAIALPRARVDLVEATARKCEVIERLASAAGLRNARALPTRSETWARGEGHEAYDVVVARAVASLAVLVEYAAPLLRRGGALVAWKGARDEMEERAGRQAAEIVGLRADDVLAVQPFAAARARHLHVYAKGEATPARFPRRPGVATKRPLGS